MDDLGTGPRSSPTVNFDYFTIEPNHVLNLKVEIRDEEQDCEYEANRSCDQIEQQSTVADCQFPQEHHQKKNSSDKQWQD
jgi:hypothetical protein